MTESQKKANAKYLAKLEEIKIRVPAGSKTKYKQLAELTGESLNGLIIRLLDAELEWRESIKAAEEEWKQDDIEVLGLSVRTYNQLKRLCISTIADIFDKWQEIEPTLGRKALEEIREKLEL